MADFVTFFAAFRLALIAASTLACASLLSAIVIIPFLGLYLHCNTRVAGRQTTREAAVDLMHGDGDHVHPSTSGAATVSWDVPDTALRQRPGDQPLPTPHAGPDVQAAVIRDIHARRELGIRRYGTPLQPHNGRDGLRDLYEELLDSVCYLKQLLLERDGNGF